MRRTRVRENLISPHHNPSTKILNFFQSEFNLFTIVVFIYLILSLWGILKHEMWRDELQTWMIARDSSSIADILFCMRYEGHPPLWHLLLFFITRFTSHPFFMQLLHVLIATLSIVIFLNFSPFSKLQKILFTFGYFPFYEYVVKSRNYAIGMLFVFLFCTYFSTPTKKYLVLFGILFFLSQTNFMGTVIAICLGLFLLWNLYANRKTIKQFTEAGVLLGIIIFFCGIVLSISEAILPPETFHSWSTVFFTTVSVKRIQEVMCNINKVYMVFPFSVTIRYLDFSFLKKMNLFLSAFELMFLFFFFLCKPRILFLYLSGTLGLLILFYVKYGALWHTGHLYIIVMATLWLAHYMPPIEMRSKYIGLLSTFAQKYCNVFLIIILSSH